MLKRACIVGAGHSANTAAGLVAALPNWRCNMFAPRKERAAEIRAGVARGGIQLFYGPDDGNKIIRGVPDVVSKDPAEAVADCDVLLMCLPAEAYDDHMRAIAPFVKQDAWIGTACSSASVDWCVDEAMQAVGRSQDSYNVFALQNLPWACRAETLGLKCDVGGAKPFMELTARPFHRAPEISAMMGEMIHIPCRVTEGGFLGFGLSNVCQVIHIAILREHFKDWDGVTPYKEVPRFYRDLSVKAADDMAAVSEELITVARTIEARYPGLDLSVVRHIDDWIERAYGIYIRDYSTLQKKFSTNRAYEQLLTAMVEVEGGYLPQLQHRYLTEDIPYNLVGSRGVAQLAGVETPVIDGLIEWAQGLLGKEYLVDGKVAGKDLGMTFAPQRFGFNSLEDIPELRMLGERKAPAVADLASQADAGRVERATAA